ncbi:hypothetical protein [Rhodanobacter hydrolyticus]|uniref:Uncharacterized protein n=1 Tax=Rhodanobacter hydrolyticus TaxID=2250595 RepID=A0ABW8J568_9GAMM
MATPDWILHEIAQGLTRLATLSLDRTPAMDVIQGTAMAWREAITEGRQFDQQRDRERFRIAFRTLASTCTHWPAPRQLLDALPAIPNPEQVKRIEHEERRLRGLEHLAEIAKQMGYDRPEDGSDAAATTP